MKAHSSRFKTTHTFFNNLSGPWFAKSIAMRPNLIRVSCQTCDHFVIMSCSILSLRFSGSESSWRASLSVEHVRLWRDHADFWHSREQYLARLATLSRGRRARETGTYWQPLHCLSWPLGNSLAQPLQRSVEAVVAAGSFMAWMKVGRALMLLAEKGGRDHVASTWPGGISKASGGEHPGSSPHEFLLADGPPQSTRRIQPIKCLYAQLLRAG